MVPATYIIGSGLSAVAAAVALVGRGLRPTILDMGVAPDPAAAALKMRLAATEPEAWSPDELASLKRTGVVAANGIPRKLHFGSDFVFRESSQASPLEIARASMYRSFAFGGFSNVWGAVIQAVRPGELDGWPLTPAELAPHYALVRELVNGTSAPDLHPSSQARALYADLCTRRERLEREGISFEYAQLAVRAVDRDGEKGCRYCGLCLFGCPYDCRYTAPATLAALIRAGLVTYVPDLLVDRLAQVRRQVRIETRSLAGHPRMFTGDRVFLAAGLLETARIILQSLGIYDKPLRINHSDIFTIPMLRYRASAGIEREKLHTLCQLMAEIDDPSICRHRVHLQFYGYNELYRRLVAARLGLLCRPLAPLLDSLSTRLFVVFGYLHSAVSSSIRLTLSRNGDRALKIEGRPNPEARRVGRAVAGKLLKARRCFKAVPLPFQLRLDLPGGGYHSGGTFPMRQNPESLETDRLGRLHSLPGVHIVDASVLPTVTASPTAFTVMANAHRIATEAPFPDDD
jgi:choline dehydrogenase-like flavoprotein